MKRMKKVLNEAGKRMSGTHAKAVEKFLQQQDCFYSERFFKEGENWTHRWKFNKDRKYILFYEVKENGYDVVYYFRRVRQ